MNPLFLALVVGAVVLLFSSNAGKGLAAAGLSERRKKALEILDEVVPSAYGVTGESGERFAKLAPGYKAELVDGKLVLTAHDKALPETFTTCGYLPCYMGARLGLAQAISQCGLEQLRINGKQWGAWVEPGEGREPRPGDVYGIDISHGDPLIVHVGVFVGKNPDGTWRMADAGQGTKALQKAEYTGRVYDPTAKTLTLLVNGKPTLPRRLAGWVNLDKVPAANDAKPAAKMIA
jgi:hypothetical protein